PEDIQEKQQDLVKDKVGMHVRRALMDQPKKMQQAQTTARYAERLGKDAGGDMGAIIMAAHLMHIPSPNHSETGNSDSQVTAGSILEKVGAKETVQDKVKSILEALTGITQDMEPEACIVHDADTLALMEEEAKTNSLPKEELAQRIQGDFLTDHGQALARQILLR
ncbi:MAG: hypothetical protein R6V55_16415, partial [Desulfovermiculus sp.]